MDLEVLITSNNPVVAVETIEEDRLCELLTHLAWRLNLPLFTWDCNMGLGKVGLGNAAIYQTKEPLAALATTTQIEAGLFFFKDLRHYLDDPKVQRTLKDMANGFSNRKTIVFTGDPTELPGELQEILINCPLPLPTKKQMRDILDRFLAASPQVTNGLSADETDMVLENLRGLTAF